MTMQTWHQLCEAGTLMTATTSPTVALPEAMSTRPNHNTAMIHTFIISNMNGIVVSVRRSAEIVPFISLPLNPAKRSISWPIRTKTRMQPDACQILLDDSIDGIQSALHIAEQ